MRIAFLCPRFLTSRGGAELHAWQLARGLTDRGHELSIVTSALKENEHEYCIGHDERIALRMVPRFARRERIAGWILNLENHRGLYRLVRRIRKSGWLDMISKGPYCPAIVDKNLYHRYDVAALMGYNTCWEWLFARVAGRLRQTIPVVIPLLHPREPSAHLPIHHRPSNRMAHAIAKTQYEKDFLLKKGWDEESVSVSGVASDSWPHPVSGETFRAAHGIPITAPVILFVGRKIYNKGVAYLIQAMDAVWDRFPEARLVLVGFAHNPPEWLDGYLGRCRNDARRRTVNLDNIDDEQRENAIKACTVMALPSISDSFGIVYLEAWRNQKPVIGCRDTCAESFIEHETNGLLVDFGDVPALASSILFMLDHPGQAAQMGQKGYEKWEACFRTPIIAEEVEALFIQLYRRAQKHPN